MKNVFVFGSNLAGRHGRGAALEALRHYGAIYGIVEGIGKEGPLGSSYALPTRDGNLRTLSLKEIQKHIDKFLVFAREHPDLTFNVTRVGCGLAGLKDKQVAPMFKDIPKNCIMPVEWG